MHPESKAGWYPKLTSWKNWEIPVPGREAVVGFAVVLVICVLLHLTVLWICASFKTG